MLCSLVASQPRRNHNGLKSLNFLFQARLSGGRQMSRLLFACACGALIATAAGVPAQAQAPARPQIATTKVSGTDNVYIFRNGNHQAMFVVTKDGVIATD